MGNRWKLPFGVMLFVAAILTALLDAAPGMLLSERFFSGYGWVQIGILTLYAGLLAYKMQDRDKAPRWRSVSWTLFSVLFFGQLLLGLLVSDRFLLTGTLHFPIPVMILAGPLYRVELSFMTLLFLSTIVLTGPAWCSQLCYFGALDHLAAGKKGSRLPVVFSAPMRNSVLLITVAGALLLRWVGASQAVTSGVALLMGILGLMVMVWLSRRHTIMVHCTAFCPIGTLVQRLKSVNPFRLQISSACTRCMGCLGHCRYDALHKEEILKGKPGLSCTLCGDCMAGCTHNAIVYRFPGLSAQSARFLWLFLTISLHALFLAVARI